MDEEGKAFITGLLLGLFFGIVMAIVAQALFSADAPSPTFMQALDTWHKIEHMKMECP